MSTENTTDWRLPAETINSLQQASIERLVKFLKWSHHCDVIVRKDGVDHRFEADWIKHLVKVENQHEQS